MDVTRYVHEAWHTLYGMMTPYEVALSILGGVSAQWVVKEVYLRARWQGTLFEFFYHMKARDTTLPPRVLLTQKQAEAWNVLFAGLSVVKILREVLALEERAWSPVAYFDSMCFKLRGPRGKDRIIV